MARFAISKAWLLLAVATLAGCAQAPTIVDHPSANQDGRVRFLVLHFTDEDFERSLDLLTNRHENPVSAHYLVSRASDLPGSHGKPTVLRLVDEAQRAWLAGPSRWQGHEPLNGESIGVEIVYESHCSRAPRAPGASPWDADAACPYPDYPDDQVAAVIALARGVLVRHPEIDPTRVVGHADIQPENKTDPGPRFPWRRLAAAGVGAWYDDADVAYYREQFAARAQPGATPDSAAARGVPSLGLVQQALAAYGYGVEPSGEPDLRTREVLAAFQSHFLPQQRSGRPDVETAAVLFALLAKYRPGQMSALREKDATVPALPAPRRTAAARHGN
jgi:N-acetylmuramoyl-L-alanine amidase